MLLLARTRLAAVAIALSALTAAVAAMSAAQASAAPAQPPQPKSGPGGSDYPHAGFRETAGGSGDDAWYVFEPMKPQPKSAPLAVITHGYFEFSGNDNLRALVEHTVRKGNVVIYPRYQTGVATPCPGPFDIEPCMTSEVNGIKGALAYLEAREDRVQPQRDHTSYFGFSFGGIITANLANRYKALGVPRPRVIFLDDPHDGGFTGAHEPALDDDLGGIPSTTLVQCHSGATGVFDDTYTGAPGDPTEVGQPRRDASCNSVFPKLTSVPAKNKDLVLTSGDAHGSPALTADHGVCGGPNNGQYAVDAYDWGFCWKVWDALRSCAYAGTYCRYALGNTPQHRYIGTWSDGTPIVGLKIQEEAPIRAEPVPAREPAPPANRAPTARIAELAPTVVRGKAFDDDAVTKVAVALVRTSRAGCRQMTRTGRFAALAKCGRPTRFLPTHGTASWSLRLPKRLGDGTYRLVVRVTDSDGKTRLVRKILRLSRGEK
jgi:hypothetical protein